MINQRQVVVWALAILAVLFAIYHLKAMLLPFVAGIGVAYFLDPLTDKIEAKLRSRTAATALVIVGFFFLVGAAAFFLYPLLQAQVVNLAARAPELVDALTTSLKPVFARIQADLTPEYQTKLSGAVEQYAGSVATWFGSVLEGVWSGGLAVVGMLSLMLISPLVAFYLLRDWDNIVARIDNLLPRDNAATIRTQVHEIDRTLAAFVRGQGIVCLVLATYYGTGLALAGLESGLLIGILTGLAAFIPYLGVLTGLAVAVAVALVQFDAWQPVAMVVAVIGVGHVLEGGFLTPKLLGGRVGLHPAWVLFALMAGATLFGFTGVLLAVPTAAVVGVLVRFGTTRYLQSRLYQGTGPGS